MYIGEFKITDTITFNFQAQDGNGVAVDPSDTPSYIVYEGNEVMSPEVSGEMSKIDGQTGFYGGSIELTLDAGFAAGQTYTIRIQATVDGVTVATLYTFNTAVSGSTSAIVIPSGLSVLSQTLDASLMSTAYSLIYRRGKTVVFKTYPAAVYDPTTGETTLGNSVDYTHKIIPPYPYSDKYINGDTIRAGDIQTGIAALGLLFVPDPSATKVVIDTIEWSIVNMQPVYSGEQIALYMLQLRR